MNTRLCKKCGKEIRDRRPSAVFCSTRCSSAFHAQKFEYWEEGRKADRGAMSELLACADLLKRGFEVYRNVSPHGSSDLVIRKGQILLTVEVRTARKDKNGRIFCPKKNLHSSILALVFNSSVSYEPQNSLDIDAKV